MKVYVFGNPDFEGDTRALKVAKKLESKIEDIKFVTVNPNQDLPFAGEENIIILDTIKGIEKVTKITEKDLDKIKLEKSVTVHDFDLGFQLKYLKKLGKLKSFTIVGLPQGKGVDYLRIQSTFKKLVAQDIQGS